MTTRHSAKSIFDPLLRQFCQDTEQTEIDENFSSIFLPHTMSGYDNADKRIFYFGRDTNGWLATKKLMQNFKDQQLDKYIDDTSSWINDYGFLDYNKNAAYGFWTLAMKLHLRLKGITDHISIDKTFYDHDHIDLLNDFGYGNTNAIEVQKSLQNQGIWETLDKSKYWQVKEKSKIFDKLIHTIKVYQPDLVFIFNWACDEKLFLDGLNYTEEKLDLVNNQFWIYTLHDTNTKVVWTVHPRTLPFNGYNTDELIDAILNVV